MVKGYRRHKHLRATAEGIGPLVLPEKDRRSAGQREPQGDSRFIRLQPFAVLSAMNDPEVNGLRRCRVSASTNTGATSP
ncbi:MAG: hypothetical protein KFB96_07665 [Thiocapsa sp.]|uniref:hypothetical protein n=1 Tax=Thiocapsa sp. TaxID=2024551 RepID=UPI001BCBB633|nr:hypothetical protein [Thiocapsa sp.]QVL50303.1 MAG: hypothetical protein KFB96_07665 [Thiocapsa sp.]